MVAENDTLLDLGGAEVPAPTFRFVDSMTSGNQEKLSYRSGMETRRCGPSGGLGGVPFSDVVLPQDFRVLEVRVYARDQVDGLQIVHETVDGARRVFSLHGRATGERYVLRLDADEFITSIRGYCGEQISSISIQTNKQTSPVLGREGDGVREDVSTHCSEYHYEAPSGAEIVGFWGQAGNRVDALGVIMRRRGL